MKALTRTLLEWYRQNRIAYPWRKTTRPYPVWLSEILLQQTRIPVVLDFYPKILKRYPNIQSLAEAKDSEFLAMWSGIGYYSRAHNMLACARNVVNNHNGAFPEDLTSLLKLPGIGKYTAGAIRNICFESLTPAIDGNIRRVLSRLSTSETDLENTFVRFGNGALPADYFQSLMELGEQICLPNPRCNLCPVRNFCRAHRAGVQNKFPRKNNKKATEIMHWYLLILNSNNAFYYLRNSSRDFLKQAWIFPDLLAKHKLPERDLLHQFRTQHGIELHGIQEKRTISHAVTFRKIFTHVLIPENFRIKSSNGKWLTKRDFKQHPTSSITKKVLRSLEIQNRQTKPFQQSLKQS